MELPILDYQVVMSRGAEWPRGETTGSKGNYQLIQVGTGKAA